MYHNWAAVHFSSPTLENMRRDRIAIAVLVSNLRALHSTHTHTHTQNVLPQERSARYALPLSAPGPVGNNRNI